MMQGFLPTEDISIAKNRWRPFYLSSMHHQSERTQFFDVGKLAIAAGRALEQTLDSLFPMSPFRAAPRKDGIFFQGTSPEDVGYQGDLLPDLLFRRPELVEETDKWLKTLDMGYELDVKSLEGNSGDLFEVRTHRYTPKGTRKCWTPRCRFWHQSTSAFCCAKFGIRETNSLH